MQVKKKNLLELWFSPVYVINMIRGVKILSKNGGSCICNCNFIRQLLTLFWNKYNESEQSPQGAAVYS